MARARRVGSATTYRNELNQSLLSATAEASPVIIDTGAEMTPMLLERRVGWSCMGRLEVAADIVQPAYGVGYYQKYSGACRGRTMTFSRSSASLLGLDAVVIDTETTGLDPGNARIVELAVMRLVAGRLDRSSAVRRLVNPGTKIPSEATRIHKIDDAAVAEAQKFRTVWPAVSALIDGHVLIGHTLNFDLALLRYECARIGKDLAVEHTLDVRLLAEIAEPNLASFSIESLASWLGVDVVDRHSALGDVITTGNIFTALVPRLRARGIRTLAEATRASAALAERLPAGTTAASDAANVPYNVPRSQNRIDVRLYRDRVESVMTSPPHVVGPEAIIGETIGAMTKKRISSVFVFARAGAIRPDETGIMTERDVLRAFHTHGAEVGSMPVRVAMSQPPLHTVLSDAFAHVAVARMNRLAIRHLGVINPSGNIVGAVSARDLLRLRAEGAAELGDEIEQAADVHELARAWGKLALVVAELVREGLSAREVAALISHQCCELTRRAAVLAESQMKAEGQGGPPAAYALLVLGSAGRGESLLAMDQDNALVFADGAPEGADRWFETLAARTADILHAVGIPYCKGRVMAKNPQWRGSLTAWRERVDGWIQHSNPQDLLSVDIFFDMRAVHGSAEIADVLRRHAFEVVRGRTDFAKLLIASVGLVEPSLTWFGFRTNNGRLNLKKAGLFGIVSCARALAICHHVTEHSTAARLEGIRALNLGMEADLESLTDAHHAFLNLILWQQIVDIEQGLPASNSVRVKVLSRREQQRLRSALRLVEHLDNMTRDLLFKT